MCILVVRARGLVLGPREFESRGLHLKPETKLSWGKGVMLGGQKMMASNLVISDCASDPRHKRQNRNNNSLVQGAVLPDDFESKSQKLDTNHQILSPDFFWKNEKSPDFEQKSQAYFAFEIRLNWCILALFITLVLKLTVLDSSWWPSDYFSPFSCFSGSCW